MNVVKTICGKRFDRTKAENICSVNYNHDDTRGSNVWKTASGNFVRYDWSRWQGESDSWELLTKEEAFYLVLDESAETAKEHFPNLFKNFTEDI